MPSIFNEQGFRGMVYPNDHEPPHVHVVKNRSSIKIEVDNFEIIGIDGDIPKRQDVNKAIKLAKKYQDAIIEKWQELHHD